ncbi:hypothetical protein [Nostoc sp. TCL240-02]|uniref:NACHT C-terminal helical domain 2-containing protein n=1 Tax=Nostoc sp. TCL240-02 TaxID=2572090 RepID=UPI00157FA648|nr:hypothetical protein [Nostoc sp. TCL240-02]
MHVDFCHRILYFLIENTSNLEFHEQIIEIQNGLPSLSQDEEFISEWVVTDRYIWLEKLRSLMIKNRNIGHKWQFNNVQKELLRQYYDANKLLVDCLNSDCSISPEVRHEIEDTLFLPIKS